MALEITIATAPCSWGVWYADGRPSRTPWNVFLDQAAGAGYRSLELGPDGYLPFDEEKLRGELSRRNLDICAGTACYQFDRYVSFDGFLPRVETLCRRLKAFNAPYLVTMDESDVGTYSEKKKEFGAELWKRYFTMFRDMAVYTREEFGIEMVYHPHIRSLVETEEEIKRMIDYCDLNLCFDLGHHVYVNGGVKPDDQSAFDFIQAYPERIKYLHFKNVHAAVRKKVLDKGLSSGDAFDLGVMCDLKDGIINYGSLRNVLSKIDYSGIGIIEMDMPTAANDVIFAAAKRNLLYLREIGMIQ
jgi:inosose dehydratase